MEQFLDNFLTIYLPILIAAWPLFAALAALTPNEVDNKLLAALRKVLDAIAFNFGNAKNEKSSKTPSEVHDLRANSRRKRRD